MGKKRGEKKCRHKQAVNKIQFHNICSVHIFFAVALAPLSLLLLLLLFAWLVRRQRIFMSNASKQIAIKKNKRMFYASRINSTNDGWILDTPLHIRCQNCSCCCCSIHPHRLLSMFFALPQLPALPTRLPPAPSPFLSGPCHHRSSLLLSISVWHLYVLLCIDSQCTERM